MEGWFLRADGMNGDIAAIVLVQVFLLALWGPAVCYDARERAARKKTEDGFDATVIRGDANMNALYVVYGFATGACGLMITETEALSGHKSLFLLIDYAMLTYLFFFSSWFRNHMLFKALQRIKID